MTTRYEIREKNNRFFVFDNDHSAPALRTGLHPTREAAEITRARLEKASAARLARYAEVSPAG